MMKAWQQLSEEALSSTRRVSEWLGKDTIRSASSRAACPSCLIPESDTLLPSPSALSLSPSILLCSSHWLSPSLFPHYCQMKNPPTGKTAVKVWLSGGIHPHFTQCRATRVTVCMHTHHACEFPVKAYSEFPSLECELRATHDKYRDILKSPKRTS